MNTVMRGEMKDEKTSFTATKREKKANSFVCHCQRVYPDFFFPCFHSSISNSAVTMNSCTREAHKKKTKTSN